MGNRPCVLVVEDEQVARATICETLQDAGCRVMEAADGHEAQERLEAAGEPPCVILLDLMMPRVDGWQFRAWQRHDPRFASVPVVLLSAIRDLPATAQALEAEYLAKPLSFATLLAAVEKHCGPCQAA